MDNRAVSSVPVIPCVILPSAAKGSVDCDGAATAAACRNAGASSYGAESAAEPCNRLSSPAIPPPPAPASRLPIALSPPAAPKSAERSSDSGAGAGAETYPP